MHVSTAGELIDALNEPLEHVTIELAAGEYVLAPGPEQEAPHVCDYGGDVVMVTVGATITGRDVQLVGPRSGEAVIQTHAEHGIYFNACENCVMDRVTISGGDTQGFSPFAAAVVVRDGKVRIVNCMIRDNVGGIAPNGRPAGIVGISAGGRADLTVESCEITGNSWNGITLFDTTRGVVRNNLMIGTGSVATGIAIDCGAGAVVERNHVRNFDYGFCVSAGAKVSLRANIIEQMAESGVLIGAGRGEMRMLIEKNVIYRCGREGVYVGTEAGTGFIQRNLIVGNGSNDKWPFRGAITMSLRPGGIALRNNTCYANAASADSLDHDVPSEAFWRARRPWTRTYRNTPVGVDGRYKFYESAFLTRYGRWAD